MREGGYTYLNNVNLLYITVVNKQQITDSPLFKNRFTSKRMVCTGPTNLN